MGGVVVYIRVFYIVVSEFELQLRKYIHFQTNTLGKGMNPIMYTAMRWIVAQLVLFKDGFGIKLLTKVDMPLST